MENKEYKFKTSLNCGNCVAKVQADLDQTAGINTWKVDTDQADKILTVQAQNISEDEIMNIIKSKGFKIEPIA